MTAPTRNVTAIINGADLDPEPFDDLKAEIESATYCARASWCRWGARVRLAVYIRKCDKLLAHPPRPEQAPFPAPLCKPGEHRMHEHSDTCHRCGRPGKVIALAQGRDALRAVEDAPSAAGVMRNCRDHCVPAEKYAALVHQNERILLRANRLADECGRLADDNRALRVELADALRKVARLERKQGGR